MKTLISINRVTWGDVKKYATVKGLSLNSAVEHLLTVALGSLGNTSTDKGGISS